MGSCLFRNRLEKSENGTQHVQTFFHGLSCVLLSGWASLTQVQSLGQENPLEKEMATHSSILAWKIPWTEEPGRLQFVGSQKRWTQLNSNNYSLSWSLFSIIFWGSVINRFAYIYGSLSSYIYIFLHFKNNHFVVWIGNL